ncbi:MAG: tyrosine-type recombinase/integrase, partial [Pseudonocardia sp.]
MRSPHTATRYRRDLACFVQWVDERGLDTFALLPWQLAEYAAALRDGWAGELKASTRAGRINAVSSFYRFVQRNAEGYGVRNPAEHTPRPEVSRRSKTRRLSADELAELRREARRRSAQLYALVQLLVGSGVRISEALDSDTHHLRREGAEWYLYVQRKGVEDRVPVQVPVEAVRALHRHLRGRKGP